MCFGKVIKWIIIEEPCWVSIMGQCVHSSVDTKWISLICKQEQNPWGKSINNEKISLTKELS